MVRGKRVWSTCGDEGGGASRGCGQLVVMREGVHPEGVVNLWG